MKRQRPVEGSFKMTVKEQFSKFKTDKGCQICGYNRLARNLCFHHVKGGGSWQNDRGKTLQEKRSNARHFELWMNCDPELNDCVILCHNCHGEVEAGIVQCK
jgi:hypothetical protein